MNKLGTSPLSLLNHVCLQKPNPFIKWKYIVKGEAGAAETHLYGIDGSNLVGEYKDTSGYYHAFVYTIPEPASALLIGAGILFARLRRR